MLQDVLKAKEQQLAKKAQQRLHWWSRHRLRTLILVVPALTKDTPLWSYDEESLACARLCGLTVIELQSKLRIYWEKTAWQRWLLYWFTPIRQQLTVWTYYQQCMTFRSWKESIQTSETINYSCPYAGEIINRFTALLIKKMFKLEGYIDRHAMRWRKKPRLFKEEMADSECQQSSKLSWDLRKALLDTVPICKMYSTRNIVKTAYEKTIKALYQYFFDYYRNTYVKILFSPPPQCMQLVLASTSSSAILANPSPIKPSLTPTNPTTELGISSFNFSVWVNIRQKQIKTVLQQPEPNAVTQAMYLLQESFSSLTDLIDPLITPIQDLIYRMHWSDRIHTQDALQFISLLENQLVKLYRAAIPLFHPDKYHTPVAGENQALKTLCNQLTCHYQNFIEKCHKKLEDRKQDIFKIEIQRQANEKRFPTKQLSWAEMWEEIENIKKGIKAFDEKMEKTDAKLKNHEARIQALFRKRQQQGFYQSHRIFKLNRSKLPALKEELEGENASVIFNK